MFIRLVRLASVALGIFHRVANSALGFAIAFVALRLLFVWYSPQAYIVEEAKQTTFAAGLYYGNLRLPWFAYLDSPHSGGSFVISLMLLPFFFCLGAIPIAVKLCAITISLVTALLALRLLNGNATVKAFAGLLLLLPVPAMLQKSVNCIGNIDLVFLCLFALALLLENSLRSGSPSPLYTFVTGVLTGLGCFIQYGFAPALLLVPCIYYLKKVRSLRHYALWGFGSAIGLLPLLFIQQVRAVSSADSSFSAFLPLAFSSPELLKMMTSLGKALFIGLPKSLHLSGVNEASSAVLSYIYAAVLALGWVGFARRGSRSPGAWLIGAYGLCVFPLLALGGFRGEVAAPWGVKDYNHLYYFGFIHWPALFIAILGLHSLWLSARGLRRVVQAAICLGLVASSSGNLLFAYPYERQSGEHLNGQGDLSNAFEFGFSSCRNSVDPTRELAMCAADQSLQMYFLLGCLKMTLLERREAQLFATPQLQRMYDDFWRTHPTLVLPFLSHMFEPNKAGKISVFMANLPTYTPESVCHTPWLHGIRDVCLQQVGTVLYKP